MEVGDGNQSDDSSGEEGSSWVNYRGDGEGRRERIERHTSSESEQNRPRQSRNQTADRQESLRSDSSYPRNRENRADNNVIRAQDSRSKKLNEKLKSEPGDNVDTVDSCVIPDGPKPGMSNNVTAPRTDEDPAENETRGHGSHNLLEAVNRAKSDQHQRSRPPGPQSEQRRGHKPKPLRSRNTKPEPRNDLNNALSRSTGNLHEENNTRNPQGNQNIMYRSTQDLSESGRSDMAKNIMHRSTPNLHESDTNIATSQQRWENPQSRQNNVPPRWDKRPQGRDVNGPRYDNERSRQDGRQPPPERSTRSQTQENRPPRRDQYSPRRQNPERVQGRQAQRRNDNNRNQGDSRYRDQNRDRSNSRPSQHRSPEAQHERRNERNPYAQKDPRRPNGAQEPRGVARRQSSEERSYQRNPTSNIPYEREIPSDNRYQNSREHDRGNMQREQSGERGQSRSINIDTRANNSNTVPDTYLTLENADAQDTDDVYV